MEKHQEIHTKLATIRGKALLAKHNLRRSIGPIKLVENANQIIPIHEKGMHLFNPLGAVRIHQRKVIVLHNYEHNSEKEIKLRKFANELAKLMGVKAQHSYQRTVKEG